MIDEDLKVVAKDVRKNILKLARSAGSMGAHIGPSLSIVEILSVLYGRVMKYDLTNRSWNARDRFILSKGHGALCLYCVLFEAGFITIDDLNSFEFEGGFFPGQPILNVEKGIEMSSGSLGMGLSFGVGVALSSRLKNNPFRTFVLMGDGEVNEGSVWEASMSAAHYKLGSLVAIIDNNGMQSDGKVREVMDTCSLEKKWDSFGWHVIVTDGHDTDSLGGAFGKIPFGDKPTVIIARTVKGKGVSFMENAVEWHHSAITQDQFERAMKEMA